MGWHQDYLNYERGIAETMDVKRLVASKIAKVLFDVAIEKYAIDKALNKKVTFENSCCRKLFHIVKDDDKYNTLISMPSRTEYSISSHPGVKVHSILVNRELNMLYTNSALNRTANFIKGIFALLFIASLSLFLFRVIS